MARKRRRGFVAIPFQTEITLATLANNAVLSAAILTLGEDLFLISIDATWTLAGIDLGEMPIAVGFAHGDLSDTEIAEALTAALTDPDDIITKERSRRPVRKAGVLAEGSAIAGSDVPMSDGDIVRTRMKMSIGDGHTIDVWAQNRSGAANLTGGMIVKVEGTIYGRWQR